MRRKRGKKSMIPDKDKRFDKDKSSDCDVTQTRKMKNGSNDPQWYATDPALLRDAASLSFSFSTGLPVTLAPEVGAATTFTVPGIMTIPLAPSIGWASSPASPINVAGTSVFSYVRSTNSGTAYGSPETMMLYLEAASQIYSYINFLMRAYGAATLYAQQNRYVPVGLLLAMGFSTQGVTDVQNNLAQLRYGINLLINKAASLAVPASFPIFNRRAFVYQNIYTEGTSMRDQLYMYVPAGFHQLSYDSEGKMYLRYLPKGVKADGTVIRWLGSVKEALDFGNSLLNPILQNEDMNIISGNILKAFGVNNIIQLKTLDEVYPLIPVFNIGVLEQMKNATCVDFGLIESLDITQAVATSGSYLSFQPQLSLNVSQPVIKRALQIYSMPRVLTTTTADTSPELVIESSRLMVAGADYEENSSTSAATLSLFPGAEIPGPAVYHVYLNTQQQGWTQGAHIMHYADVVDMTSGDSIQNAEQQLNLLQTMSNFDFHPVTYVVLKPSDTGWWQSAPFFDMDNYTVIHSEELIRLHEAATMNLYHVPSIAKL